MSTSAPTTAQIAQAPQPKTAKTGRRRPRLHTAEDLLRISADSTHRYELIQGELVTMSPAGYEHGVRAMLLGSRISIFAEDNDLGSVASAETGFLLEHAPDTVRAPDVAYVRKERTTTGSLPRAYFPGAPDLAVEVVSPNDTAADVQAKVQDWLSHATQLVWVVYPSSRTVTVYRANGTASILTANDVLDGEDVLPGFRFSLERLFGGS